VSAASSKRIRVTVGEPVVRQISPGDVAVYLCARGWEEASDRITPWWRAFERDGWRQDVPDPSPGLEWPRLAEALSIAIEEIAGREGRPAGAVLRDIAGLVVS
jgi:hypothetical protein